MTPQCANRQREITTPRLSIIDPPNITLIEAPPLKFIKFSLFPHEIQLKIWRAALEPAINHQPRIVAAHTLIPPRTETHEMVRILAQTCTMSRELALPLLKQCQEHEDRHYLAIPRQPPVAVAAAAMAAAAAAVAAPPTLAPAIPANNLAGFVTMTAQMNAQINAHLMNAHLNRLESTPLAPLRQLKARERRTYPFNMPGEDLMETHYCLNPLHNHIHVDNDYFLFLDQTTSLLHYENSRFSSIISLVQKIIIPASTLYKILKLSPHQMMMPMPSPDWLFTNAKEVVVILPICADLGEFDDTYGSTQESAKANVALTNDSARWSEASEIPYGLLHFWTDEEMVFFDDSMYSRWMYWSEQNTVQDGMIRLPRRRQRDDSSPHPFWNEKAAEHRKLLAARSKRHNPFDDLDDFHLLFGLCHIWRQVSKSPQRAPQMRFAHVRGLRAYDFLGEALGHGREPVVVNWQNYIPRHSSTEIYNTVTFRRVVRLDSKRTSQRYPVRGKDKESDEGDAVCPLNHLTQAEQQQQEEYWHMCAYSGDENV